MLSVVQAYNQVTEKLKRSHETLFAEVQRLRDELDEKNKELQRRERLAALGEMAAGVAHEIRNPLGGIGLYASLLERDLADRPTQQDIARRITAGVQNLEAIIRDILAFAGDAEPRMTPAALGSVIETALEPARAKLDTMQIRLDVDPRVQDVNVCCDPAQIGRAISNLVFNGIDAVGRGGCIWIRLAGSREDSVSVAVEDNGPGIDPAVLPRIFNPFFTTKDRGTGLGLSIVHGTVEAHGGRVSAGARVGGGASFVLTLPRSRGVTAAPQHAVGEIRSVDFQEIPTTGARRSPLSIGRQGGKDTHGSYRRS
jgi:signal transduction histidine kinase